jgi:hypothetical protein
MLHRSTPRKAAQLAAADHLSHAVGSRAQLSQRSGETRRRPRVPPAEGYKLLLLQDAAATDGQMRCDLPQQSGLPRRAAGAGDS